MPSRVDNAIFEFVRSRSDAALLGLHMVFMEEQVHVPVVEPVKELGAGRYDVPVLCVRTETGAGAIPVFTTMEHLLKWKPQGCLYTSLRGRSLIAMAIGMDCISEILVNPDDIPRGRIPRGDFQRMLTIGGTAT